MYSTLLKTLPHHLFCSSFISWTETIFALWLREARIKWHLISEEPRNSYANQRKVKETQQKMKTKRIQSAEAILCA